MKILKMYWTQNKRLAVVLGRVDIFQIRKKLFIAYPQGTQKTNGKGKIELILLFFQKSGLAEIYLSIQ